MEVNKDLIYRYLNTLSKNDYTYFLRLYNLYQNLNKMIVNKEELKERENEIFNIDGKIMSEEDRVISECKRLSFRLTNPNEHKELNDYFVLLEDYDDIDDSLLNYIKKRIVNMELSHQMYIAFYETAYKMFEERYSQIKKDSYHKKVNL